MRSLTFGDYLIITFASTIVWSTWGKSDVAVLAIAIVVVVIIEIIIREKQYKRYISKQDLEALEKKIKELIASSEEFKRVNDSIMKHINQQP